MRQCLRLQLSSIRLTRTLLSFWWKSVFLTCCIIVHTRTRQHGKTFCKQLQEFGLWLTAVKIRIWMWTEQKWINKERTTGWNKRYRHRNRKLFVLACTAGMHHSVCLIFSVSVLMNRGMWLSLQNYYTKYDFFSCLTITADLLLACLLETFMSLPFFLLEYKVLVLISFTNTFLYRSKIFTQLQKYKWNRLLAVKLSKTHRVLLGSTKLLFAVWLLKEIKVCVTCKSLEVPGSHPNFHSWGCLFTLLPLKLELF